MTSSAEPDVTSYSATRKCRMSWAPCHPSAVRSQTTAPDRRARRDEEFRGSASGFGRVQGHGGAHERLQRLLVDLVALVQVDRPPGVPLEAGVEEARRILQRRPFGEGHLHDVLVRFAVADHAVGRPPRTPSPLPLLDDVGIVFLDQGGWAAELLAPPVAELPDSFVDQPRRRLALLRSALRHARFSLLG